MGLDLNMPCSFIEAPYIPSEDHVASTVLSSSIPRIPKQLLQPTLSIPVLIMSLPWKEAFLPLTPFLDLPAVLVGATVLQSISVPFSLDTKVLNYQQSIYLYHPPCYFLLLQSWLSQSISE